MSDAVARVVAARPRAVRVAKPNWKRRTFLALASVMGLALLYHLFIVYQVIRLKGTNPSSTALIDQRIAEAEDKGVAPKREQTWVPYERVSSNLIRAVLAGEDSRFFDHSGFDWEAIEKAIKKDWEEKRFARGASTVSQQLAKNMYLSTSKNPFRKAHEALITSEMELILGKRRILELYLNVIEWGDGVYGAEAAARHYFNTSAASLSSDQAAFLSAIIPGPRSAFDPSKHRRRVDRRRNLILRLMRHVVIPKDLS